MIVNEINLIDKGFRVKDFDITPPTPKNASVNMPLAHGGILVNPLNMVLFNNRTISLTVDKKISHAGEAYTVFSKLGEILYSKPRYSISFDWDKNFFWIGRCVEVEIDRAYDVYAEYKITFEVEPFKYDIQVAGEPWLWNPFSFLNGIIASKPTKIVKEGNIVVVNRLKPVNPTIESTAACTIEFEEKKYTLKPGVNFFPEIILKPGRNIFHVWGDTTITIKYRMGEL